LNKLIPALLFLTLALTGCGSKNSPAPSNLWTWVSGSSSANEVGVYGSEGTSSTSNVPGAREYSSTWKDSSGNLWLFGGQGLNSSSATVLFNDLWEYNATSKTWIWMNGSSSTNQSGDYGTVSVATTSNSPGARYGATNWTDSSSVFWLFGGEGYDASGAYGTFNDLWKYDASAGEWTWMKGSDSANQTGSYSSQGTVSSSNLPASRRQSCSAVDGAARTWVFAGNSYSGSSYNDLWVYNPSTNQWTWESGSSSSAQPGVYGTKGSVGSSNVPGSRLGAVCWIDTSTNYLWVFGGYGYDINGNVGMLNDLWKVSLGTLEWVWVGGSSTYNAGGTYGTEGTGSTSNTPGGRIVSSSWRDSSGDLWLFGGEGYDMNSSLGYLNDLWKYDPTSSQWTWVGGANTVNSSTGTYGTKGSASSSNIPGSRVGSASWIDSSGYLWLFGGYYSFSSTEGQNGYKNDLWKYQP
jgi:N-acetylneuraminic acid mutarotase